MQYISAEEFLRQSEKVQKSILDWWKPEIGDLFTTRMVNDEVDVIINVDNNIYGLNDTFKGNIYNYVDKTLGIIPLLTEGQLRQFIEDKTKTILLTEFVFDTKNYSIIGFKNCNEYKFLFDILGEDLLHAYWKVACEIAKEE